MTEQLMEGAPQQVLKDQQIKSQATRCAATLAAAEKQKLLLFLEETPSVFRTRLSVLGHVKNIRGQA